MIVGSKGGAGVAQWLINLMPAHTVYVEAFLGRGVVLQTKRPAAFSIGIDADAGVIVKHGLPLVSPTVAIVLADAFELLPTLAVSREWLIYCDPPYLMSTRSAGNRVYYGRELGTEQEHARLLSLLSILQANVMLSGYDSPLYASRLASWRKSSFWTVNRAGQRVQEFVWMNFPPPALLHDTAFVGDDFTDRQRVKRKVKRWTRKLLAMPAGERQAVLQSLLTMPTWTLPAGIDGNDAPGRIDGNGSP